MKHILIVKVIFHNNKVPVVQACSLELGCLVPTQKPDAAASCICKHCMVLVKQVYSSCSLSWLTIYIYWQGTLSDSDSNKYWSFLGLKVWFLAFGNKFYMNVWGNIKSRIEVIGPQYLIFSIICIMSTST